MVLTVAFKALSRLSRSHCLPCVCLSCYAPGLISSRVVDSCSIFVRIVAIGKTVS